MLLFCCFLFFCFFALASFFFFCVCDCLTRARVWDVAFCIDFFFGLLVGLLVVRLLDRSGFATAMLCYTIHSCSYRISETESETETKRLFIVPCAIHIIYLSIILLLLLLLLLSR